MGAALHLNGARVIAPDGRITQMGMAIFRACVIPRTTTIPRGAQSVKKWDMLQ